MAEMWYLSKHFLSSANISLSIHKKEKNLKNSTTYKNQIPDNFLLYFFFYDGYLYFYNQGGGRGSGRAVGG